MNDEERLREAVSLLRDELAAAQERVQQLHSAVCLRANAGEQIRAVALVRTKLDEAEMWLGKVAQ